MSWQLRRNLFLLCCFAFLGFQGAAIAQENKVALKLSYWVPLTHALTQGYKEWDEELQRVTKGTLSIQLFPASQLGSGLDHYDMVKGGVADIGLINPGYTPGRFPIIAVGDLPFQIIDSHAAAGALTRFYQKYAEREMADIIVCHAFTNEPGTFHMTKKEVRRPEDIRGLKIRAGNATISEYIASLDGTPVQVPIMEAFETLNRGITEGITIPWGGLVTMNFNKVVKAHTALPLNVTSFVHGINRHTYEKLSLSQKKALDGTCTPEWSAKIYRHWGNEERGFEMKIRETPDAGHIIVNPSPDDITAWRKSAEPVFASWKKAVTNAGYDPDHVYQDFRDEMHRSGALFE